MARARSPDRDKAFEIWKNSNGSIKLKDIADSLGISEGTVRGWKNKDQWDDKINGTFPKKIRNVPKDKNRIKAKKSAESENSELTEKQRLFCLYYVKSFNATMSALKAGYSKDTARIIGAQNLSKLNIQEEIKRLKGNAAANLFIDAMDILNKYAEIAFADIGDFVAFGQRERPVMGMFGPVVNKETKEPLMEIVNYIDLGESSNLDTTMITEVKQGKEGISIKFADKMKALEKLEKYFDLLPDKHKRKIEQERLELEHRKVEGELIKEKRQLEISKLKAEIAKLTGSDDSEDDNSNNFLDALSGKVKEVWDDE